MVRYSRAVRIRVQAAKCMGACERLIQHVWRVVMHVNRFEDIRTPFLKAIALNRLLCGSGFPYFGRRASCLKINIKGGIYAALHL